MIRVFSFLCKHNFSKISAKERFDVAMLTLNVAGCPCSSCGTKKPNWKRHAYYLRYLVDFLNGVSVTYSVKVIRYRCLSCKATHAILPEHVIPFKSHGLLFVLAVMRDFFVARASKKQLCRKYSISERTLNLWLRTFEA